MSGAEGQMDFNIKIPDLPDKTAATDKQCLAVKNVLTDAYDVSNLTMGQASLILDVNSYVNGMLAAIRSSKTVEFGSTSNIMMMKFIAFEAIMNDEDLWRGISKWGRDMYNLGISSQLPELDLQSDLFKKVFLAMSKHAASRANDLKVADS